MKNFDRKLIKVLLGIIVILVVYMLFVNLQGLLFVIGVLMALGAVLFVVGHIGLFMPTFAICIILAQFYNKLYDRIYEHSYILATVSRALFVIIGYFSVIFIYLYVMYMCLQYQTSWEGFSLFMDEIASM